MSQAQVLIVEDQPQVCRWLCGLVGEAFPGLSVLPAADLATARTAVRRFAGSFRLVLVDLGLPDGSGVDLIAELHGSHPRLPVVVTTVHDDDGHLFAALRAGAAGYLLKEQPDAVLLHQLRRLADGEPPLSPRMARRMLAYFQRPAAPMLPPEEGGAVLTPRETEVLACIGRGLRVAEAAQALGLTPNTVASYIKSLYAKLSIRSRAEAALEAARRGLT
jgi:DNA-binding NarL/FixJ family response regulator